MEYKVTQEELVSIADAIRDKIESSEGLEFPGQFVESIQNISTGIEPSGTIDINSNGTVNVREYAQANVNVPVGIFPEGTLEITQNGTTDVSNYANVDVNVSTGPEEVLLWENDGTITSMGTEPIVTNLSGVYSGLKIVVTLGQYISPTVATTYIIMWDTPKDFGTERGVVDQFHLYEWGGGPVTRSIYLQNSEIHSDIEMNNNKDWAAVSFVPQAIYGIV